MFEILYYGVFGFAMFLIYCFAVAAHADHKQRSKDVQGLRHDPDDKHESKDSVKYAA